MRKKQVTSNSIYKYCTSTVAKLILDNNEVLLKRPSDFNDPYDTSILFDDKDLQIARDVIINYFADLAMKKVLVEKYHELPLKQKAVAFFSKLTMKLADKTNKINREYKPMMNYAKLIKMFSRLGLKNGKPGSNSQIALEQIVDLINNGLIENKLSQTIKTESKDLLISCFSKIDDSILMWSHYADNNKGVCLEFENEGFIEVQYSNERAAFRIRNIMYKILWDYHTKQKSNISVGESAKFLIAISPFLTKSIDWSYEKEIRCIFESKNEKIIYKNEQSYYKLKKIKCIILGCRISDTDKQDIIKIAKDKMIPVFQIELSKDTYQLNKVEVQ